MVEGTVFHIERQRGRPFLVGRWTVTPVALCVRVGASWRGRVGAGFAWARPLAVEVREDGEVRSVPVPDLTLRAILALGLAGLLASALGGLVEKRRR